MGELAEKMSTVQNTAVPLRMAIPLVGVNTLSLLIFAAGVAVAVLLITSSNHAFVSRVPSKC